jgi:hypothetical protein
MHNHTERVTIRRIRPIGGASEIDELISGRFLRSWIGTLDGLELDANNLARSKWEGANERT